MPTRYHRPRRLANQPRRPRADGGRRGAIEGGVWVREQVTLHAPVRIGEERGTLTPSEAVEHRRELLSLADLAEQTIEVCDPRAQKLARD